MTKSCERSSKVEFDQNDHDQNDHDQNDHKIKSGSPLLVHTRERYKKYDGCYLGHYAQLSFGFFFTIGVFVAVRCIGMMIARSCGKRQTD